MNRPHRNIFIALLVFALAGLIFSAISTYDFVAHLDRQVHAITCSFVPGIGAADVSGSSGCHVVMMSPYSSVLRTSTWGGIPISLPALAVFAYLLFRIADIWMRNEEKDPDETRFLVVATGLPVLMTLIYGSISIALIGAMCKLCIGVYVSSLGLFVSAVLAHRLSVQLSGAEGPKETPWRGYTVYFAEGLVFVLVPLFLYLALKPDYAPAMPRCGELVHPEDKYGVRVPLTTAKEGVGAIELLDPLCPACRAFSQRLEASGLDARLRLEAVLFPLDKQCNWMVSESLHPGACAVSEAVLCAGGQPQDVLDWAFKHQEELRALAQEDVNRLYARIKQEFPRVASCVGTPAVRTRLNRSLRWAVNNSLPVVTPQLYVDGKKVCDEDTDLGLEYVLTQLLDRPDVYRGVGPTGAKPGEATDAAAGAKSGSESGTTSSRTEEKP